MLALDAPNGGLTTFEPSDHFGPGTPLLWGGTTTLHATRGIALNGGIATFEPSGRFVPRAPFLRMVGWGMGEMVVVVVVVTIPEPRDEIFVNLYDYMPHPRVTLCASSCVFSAALHERIRARLTRAGCMRARHTRTLDSLEALHASLLHHKVKRVNSRCPAQAHVQSNLHGASKMP